MSGMYEQSSTRLRLHSWLLIKSQPKTLTNIYVYHKYLIGMSVWILYTGDEATSIIDTKLLPTITALVDSLRKQDITTTNTLQVLFLWLPSTFLPSSILKSYAL